MNREHETDMPHCWCNPIKKVLPNGGLHIIHNCPEGEILKDNKQNMKTKFKKEKREEHWFAWFPVKLRDNRFCWLEIVNRTPIYANGMFQYYVYESI